MWIQCENGKSFSSSQFLVLFLDPKVTMWGEVDQLGVVFFSKSGKIFPGSQMVQSR